jgi:tetratricopeptide (TPR) repeat protein
MSAFAVRQLAPEFGPETPIDDQLGDKLAARDHLHVITVRGTVMGRGAGFTLSATAREALSGKVVFSRAIDATTLADVVPAMTQLASGFREALGEHLDAAERTRIALSANLEADHEYAVGVASDDAASVAHLRRALELDPDFPRARSYLATSYGNLGLESEAAKQIQLAVKQMDRLAERDRLKLLGDYYLNVTEDYDRAIDAYEQVLAKWPRNQGALDNVANAYAGRGDSKAALTAGLRAVKVFPRDVAARGNLGVYKILAGDYDGAIAEMKQVNIDLPHPPHTTNQYIALAALLSGHQAEAEPALAACTKADGSTGIGLQADVAIAQGRLAEARRLLATGIAADLAAHNQDGAEIKQVLVAETALRQGDRPAARTAALAVRGEGRQRFYAALVLAELGEDRAALTTAHDLAAEVAPSHRAFGRLIEAEVARAHRKPTDAVVAAQDALHISSSVFGRFLLARALLDAKRYAEAYTELQAVLARRQEAAFDLNDIPSFRYVPPFTYYLAQAQSGLGNADAAKTYAAFLAMMRDPDANDPLVADARKHVK